jgi:MFS family permease
VTISRSRGGVAPPLGGAPAWRSPVALSAMGLSIASGFAQFGLTAALADAADRFGVQVAANGSLTASAGLSLTQLGVGLALVRGSSLVSLPLSGLADQLGRRRTLLGYTVLGLVITAVAALAPSFWWFVALLACGRPLLTATNALAALVAGESSRVGQRATAVAMVTAGYGIGAGLIGLVRSALGDVLGFQGVFLLPLIPLALMPLIARGLTEPERFRRLHAAAEAGEARLRAPVLGPLRGASVRPLALLGFLTFAVAFVTGPANTYLFLYSENVLGMSTGTTAAMLLAAGPVGLAGLLAGRALADQLGRRATAAGGQVLIAAAGALAYSGTPAAAICGYLLAMLAAAVYAPAAGAQATELFPTSVRGSVAGWLAAAGVVGAVAGLVAFGAIAEQLGSFGKAALTVTVPVACAAALFSFLPETKGKEPEESAPEPDDVASTLVPGAPLTKL